MAGPRDHRLIPDENRPNSAMTRHDESPEDVFDDGFAASEYAPSIVAPSEGPEMEDPFTDDSVATRGTWIAAEDQPAAPPSNAHQPFDMLRHRNSILKSRPEQRGFDDVHDGLPPLFDTQIPRASLEHAQATPFTRSHAVAANQPVSRLAHAAFTAPGMSERSSIAPSLARTLSQSSRYNHGPAHPYALYPQDVSVAAIAVPEPVHVGFPGHLQQFQRGIGPEGEEQDIVGTDGHAEQLPPYSRYADRSGTRPAAGSTGAPREDAASLAGTQPEMQQRSPFDDPQDRLAMLAPASSIDVTEVRQTDLTLASCSSTSQLSSQTTAWTEKSWKEKTIKEKSKTKVFGILRIWVILLIVAVAAFIAIFCGVFVTVMHNRGGPGGPPPSMSSPPPKNVSGSEHVPSTVTYIDSAPTTSSIGLAPLPTGSFLVPLGPPDVEFNACVGGVQADTWTCTIPGQQTICVDIEETDDGRAYLNSCNNDAPPMYGSQAPFLLQQTLKLVTDLSNVSLGPAWHFQTFYDKLVVLPQSFLAAPSSSSKAKRDEVAPWAWPFAASSVGKRQTLTIPANGTISPGDQAWFCYWDDTFIEGFIYATVSNPGSAAPSTFSYEFYTSTSPAYPRPTDAAYGGTSTVQSSSATTTTAATGKARRDGADMLARAAQWEQLYEPNYYPAEDNDYGTESGNLALHPEDFPVHGIHREYEQSAGSSSGANSPSSGYATSSSSYATATTTSLSSSALVTSNPSCIPKLVRLEERRLQGLHDVAKCQLMSKLPDDSFTAVMGTTGATPTPISVELNEDDGPDVVGKMRMLKRMPMMGPMGAVGGGAALERRQIDYVSSGIASTCFCQWSSEQFD